MFPASKSLIFKEMMRFDFQRVNRLHVLLATTLLLAPCAGNAQNVWEVPSDSVHQKQEVTVQDVATKEADPNAKYLKGAVPMVNGKVVFTLEKKVPGMSATAIYNKLFAYIQSLTKEDNQFEVSKIAVVNKANHTIGARFKEWLVFRNTALSLDRTVFNYTLVAECSEQHFRLTLERISYEYEMDRGPRTGLQTTAEKWITDRYALNKKQTKLLRYSSKFRIKTIDRKDEIFENACIALGVSYNDETNQ